MTARTDLENELHGPLAASERLSEQEVAELLMLFRSARQLERAGLAEAIDQMIAALPRIFRAPTKKIMFGDLLDR